MKISEVSQIPEYKRLDIKDVIQGDTPGNIIGLGFDSIVYSVGDKVRKFAIGQPGEHTRKAIRGLTQYLKIIKRVPSNTAFPKIDFANSGIKRIGNERVYVVEMEKLDEISDMESTVISFLRSAVNIDDMTTPSKPWQTVEDVLNGNAPELGDFYAWKAAQRFWQLLTPDQKKMWKNVYETMTGLKLEAIKNELDLDLHGGNFMKRGNGEIVITDPFVKDRGPRSRLRPYNLVKYQRFRQQQ